MATARRTAAAVRRRWRTGRIAGRARVSPEQIVWIFGFARSGTTWLAGMLRDATRGRGWNEPLVGALFGEFYVQRDADQQPAEFILSTAHRDTWLPSIRDIVLKGAGARFPRLTRGQYLIIKEPNGLVGAPLLSAALPESRMVLMLRDPRDVAASALDANRTGAWTAEVVRPRMDVAALAESDPDTFVRQVAEFYRDSIHLARTSLDSHRGPKALVRYEDLRREPAGGLRRICTALDLPARDEDLDAAVSKHTWEAIPQERKGPGKFHRKATPGAWTEDLTRDQARTVEQVTGSVLAEFYPS
ncbi:MAG: sulfotransferase [Solirubrobacterales bacterium]